MRAVQGARNSRRSTDAHRSFEDFRAPSTPLINFKVANAVSRGELVEHERRESALFELLHVDERANWAIAELIQDGLPDLAGRLQADLDP